VRLGGGAPLAECGAALNPGAARGSSARSGRARARVRRLDERRCSWYVPGLSAVEARGFSHGQIETDAPGMRGASRGDRPGGCAGVCARACVCRSPGDARRIAGVMPFTITTTSWRGNPMFPSSWRESARARCAGRARASAPGRGAAAGDGGRDDAHGGGSDRIYGDLR
jgi:hypothetical protein